MVVTSDPGLIHSASITGPRPPAVTATMSALSTA